MQVFKQHAIDTYPNECCAVIIDDELVLCDNIAADKLNNFKIDPRINLKGTITAVLHSHTCKAPGMLDIRTPSMNDIVGQRNSKVPWGIVGTDGEDATEILWFDDDNLDTPLLGRKYIPHVHDCWNLIRDWYWQELDIKLKSHPEGYKWWTNDNGEGVDESIYETNVDAYGFEYVKRSELQRGDICIMQIISPVTNHGAVYLGNNEIMHHLSNRPSNIESFVKWQKHMRKYIRYIK